MHDTRLLVAVDRAELEHAQGQLTVGALARLEDQDVERAVHRLEVVAMSLVEFHGGEHALGKPLQVARGLEKVRAGDVRGVDEAVAGLSVARPGVVLHHLADEPSLGMEDGQSGAELGGEGEQVELGTEPAVVTALCLFDTVQVRLDCFL